MTLQIILNWNINQFSFNPLLKIKKKMFLRWIEKSTPPYQILWRIHSPVYQEEFQEIADIFHRTKPVILSRGGPP